MRKKKVENSPNRTHNFPVLLSIPVLLDIGINTSVSKIMFWFGILLLSWITYLHINKT